MRNFFKSFKKNLGILAKSFLTFNIFPKKSDLYLKYTPKNKYNKDILTNEDLKDLDDDWKQVQKDMNQVFKDFNKTTEDMAPVIEKIEKEAEKKRNRWS